jgi:hypothetical protein
MDWIGLPNMGQNIAGFIPHNLQKIYLAIIFSNNVMAYYPF